MGTGAASCIYQALNTYLSRRAKASCAPEGCRFPGKAVPAMEACGIDVFATARAHGLEVRTLRVLGEERNHFGLILVE